MRHRARARILTGAGIAVLAAIGWALWPRPAPPAAPAPATPHAPAAPGLPVPSAQFANAAPGVEHVGVQACAECHPAQYASYLETSHSRAFSLVQPESEPPDGEFFHTKSGCVYAVRSDGGATQHLEWLQGADGERLLLTDRRVRYVVGSGAHARTYVVEKDGYLAESPITWYAAQRKWWLSPGYDRPTHRGFERPIGEGCLFCHSGRVESLDGSAHKLAIHELAIGCERCHGPGALHAARRRESPSADDVDPTIVNPRRLPRAESESVCGQCHMGTASEAHVRGRSQHDFRPGQLLQDYLVHYGTDQDERKMTVVGHMAQMRLSRCYTASETLTCTSCHDPHHRPAPADRADFYRQQCLKCHAHAAESGTPQKAFRTGRACKLPPDVRSARTSSKRDDCAACHMPRGGTEIPHVASTQHRIGIYPDSDPEPTPAATAALPRLVAADDVSRLSPADRERCLGLAYLEFARRQSGNRERAWFYFAESRALLEKARQAGLGDGEVEAGLAQIGYELQEFDAALEHARAALDDAGLSHFSRDAVLWIVADVARRQGKSQQAVGPLKELVRYYPNSTHCLALGQTYQRLGQFDSAIQWTEQAAEWNSGRIDVQQMLLQLYQQAGKPDRAAQQVQHLQEMLNLQPRGSR